MNSSLSYRTKRIVDRTITAIYGAARRRRRGLRVLMYHSVGTPIAEDRYGLYNIPPRLFREHMRFLNEQFLSDLVPLNRSALRPSPGCRIVVTFDDGYRDNLFTAAPIMAEYGIPFTVFVWTGASKSGQPMFLSAGEIAELSQMPGAKIGSHSVSHRWLNAIPREELPVELGDSKHWLEDITGKEIETISYPHGRVDAFVAKAAFNAGYRLGGTSRFSVYRPGEDPLLIGRVTVCSNDAVPVLAAKVRGDWDWRRWL